MKRREQDERRVGFFGRHRSGPQRTCFPQAAEKEESEEIIHFKYEEETA